MVLRAEPAGAAGGWGARRGRIRRAPSAAYWGVAFSVVIPIPGLGAVWLVSGFAVGQVLVHAPSERAADAGWIAYDRTRPTRQLTMFAARPVVAFDETCLRPE
jgi:hypothetical protein